MAKSKPIGVRFDLDILSQMYAEFKVDTPQKVVNKLFSDWDFKKKSYLLGANHVNQTKSNDVGVSVNFPIQHGVPQIKGVQYYIDKLKKVDPTSWEETQAFQKEVSSDIFLTLGEKEQIRKAAALI